MIHSHLLDTWASDLPCLDDNRLRERLAYAHLCESAPEEMRAAGGVKGRRLWREKVVEVAAELKRRGLDA